MRSSSPLRTLFRLLVLGSATVGAGIPSALGAESAETTKVPRTVASVGKPLVVVTTSLLATMVHDLAGDSFAVETLMPAGTCPGQFDLDPNQARRIGSAALVLRHERQGFLDPRFAAAGVKSESVAGPHSPGLWTIPSVYASYVALVARELSSRQPTLAAGIETRLEVLRIEMVRLSEKLQSKANPLRGTRVLAAQFQAEFLQWLGLEVVGTFPPTDDPPPALIRTSLAKARGGKVSLIVGNVQSGERLPSTLASALGVPLAMLSNFPRESRAGALGPLLEDNVRILLGTIESRKP